jgi:hypothetical protein
MNIILEHLQNNEHMRKNLWRAPNERIQFWNSLASSLNAIGDGPQLTGENWEAVNIDLFII